MTSYATPTSRTDRVKWTTLEDFRSGVTRRPAKWTGDASPREYDCVTVIFDPDLLDRVIGARSLEERQETLRLLRAANHLVTPLDKDGHPRAFRHRVRTGTKTPKGYDKKVHAWVFQTGPPGGLDVVEFLARKVRGRA